MPFVADTRVPYSFQIELNICYIVELLENILEKDVSPEVDFNDKSIFNDKSNKFWLYCHQLEMDYNPESPSFTDLFCWFLDNYDNVESWKDIQDLFIDREE